MAGPNDVKVYALSQIGKRRRRLNLESVKDTE
jgi:hypothetical protein